MRRPACAQMMQNLLVEEGAVVTISSATLPKGTYVKLQPHTTVSLCMHVQCAVMSAQAVRSAQAATPHVGVLQHMCMQHCWKVPSIVACSDRENEKRGEQVWSACHVKWQEWPKLPKQCVQQEFMESSAALTCGCHAASAPL